MTALRLVALALVALLAAAMPALGADPAVTALEGADAYVSPRALGPASGGAEAELGLVAAELTQERQPVKLAIVPGPFGAPSMRVYAVRLRRALDFEGTVVVTAPGRAVVVEGPLSRATVTNRLRRTSVNAIPNPTERVIVAARSSVPAPLDEQEGSSREIIVLIGLAVLGGAWAVAWGLRRESRTRRRAVSDARAVMEVCLDALRARAIALAKRGGLSPDARARVEGALASYADGATRLKGATDVQSIDRVLLDLRGGLGELAAAGDLVGVEQPADDPFAGLCGVDPAHGPAVAVAAVADSADGVPVCAECRRAAESGEPRSRRLIPSGREAIPFSEADLRFPGIPTPGGEGLL